MTTIPWLGPVRYPTGAARYAFDITLGKMFQASPSGSSDTEVPYFKSVSVQWNGIQANQEIRMWATSSELRELAVRTGDLLICEGGDVGRAAIYDGPDGFIFEKSVHRARPVNGSDTRYLWYVLRALHGSEWLDVLCNKATIRHLTGEKLGALEIPMPPQEEQRRIADFLDAETARIDGLVNAEQRVQGRLAERRTAGVVAAVSGGEHIGRRESTLAWLESIPESWQEVRVGLLARMGSGHTPSRSHPEWWVDCTIPWITTGEVKQVRNDRLEDLYETREKISELGLANSAAELHPKGTVFLCRTAASAGYSGVMGSDMATSQDIVTWTCGPRLNPYYLLWCLRAMRPDLLGRLAMGSTHKTIYVPDLQMLRVPLPSLEEQREIVDSIRQQNSRIDSLTDKVRRQIELLTERRQTLITAAVTGQFDATTASGRNVADGVSA
ncbi:restriction endonuclease subunit S [Streptomyces bottropensis]|uniref:restriction endonuclease subunit S n=1 Tax=Streptomyces bottropensis TaxID=42235 RepID=UPI00369EAB39